MPGADRVQTFELLGNKTVSYASLIRAEDQRPLWQQIQKALVEKRIFILNYRIRTCDDREKWIWEQGQGIFSPDGELLFREGFIAMSPTSAGAGGNQAEQ